MKRLFPALAALVFAWPASAQEAGISADIAALGLRATEARLAALPEPAPDNLLALGAVRFLAAVERTLQTRWQAGMSADLMGVPVLRLPVPPNPDPAAFDPGVVNRLFQDFLTDLGAARAAFDAVGTGSGASLRLDLADVWFDIDGDGARGPAEGLAETLALVLGLRGAVAEAPPTVNFDAADAAWASAYTHLLSAAAEIVLAFDPAPQVARVAEASRTMQELGAPSPYADAMDMQFGREADLAAMIYFALQTRPDPARTRAARTHLIDMVADNRVFWSRAAAETDNDAEWIPNDRQTSALRFDFPQGLGARWQAVLDDAEALLRGDKLIPHWRLRTGAGINLHRLLDDPPPVDIAEWVHGAGLVPYAEAGERIGTDSLRAFRQLVGGDALLFMFIVN